MSTTANTVKRLWQLPGEAVTVKFKSLLKRLRPVIYFPHQFEQGFYIVAKSYSTDGEPDIVGLPIPPKDLWLGYGRTNEEYLSWGREDFENMTKINLSTNFRFEVGNRILDFGCGAGRMIRWFNSLAEECEIWGLDVSASCIIWCQQNLSPPFNFATVTTVPCLPFEDGYFDFIYCGSVFTHIDYMADAWLLELKRIIRPNGRIYVTVCDKHCVDLIINHPNRVPPYLRKLLLSWDARKHFTTTDFDMFSIFSGSPRSQVFYDIDYLCRRWGRMLNVISVTEEAYSYQTAILLEK